MLNVLPCIGQSCRADCPTQNALCGHIEVAPQICALCLSNPSWPEVPNLEFSYSPWPEILWPFQLDWDWLTDAENGKRDTQPWPLQLLVPKQSYARPGTLLGQQDLPELDNCHREGKHSKNCFPVSSKWLVALRPLSSWEGRSVLRCLFWDLSREEPLQPRSGDGLTVLFAAELF